MPVQTNLLLTLFLDDPIYMILYYINPFPLQKPKETFYNVQMLSRTFCTVQDFFRQWIVDTFIRQMEKTYSPR